MSRDDLMQYLMLFVSQGVRVPEQAFELARTVDLKHFERTPPRTAALTILRMGLQRRFSFLAVRPSLLENALARPTAATRKRRRATGMAGQAS